MPMKASQKPAASGSSLGRIVAITLAAIIALVLLAGLVVWVLWPVRKKSLQTPRKEQFSFLSAQAKVAEIDRQEKAAGVKAGCYSKLYVHPQPTAKAVLMIQGVAACPTQFSNLAQYFYDRGYNVYVPLTPHDGMTDNLEHAKVSTQELVDYTNTSVNITDALGSQVGVIGLSGGGNLATWASQYRPEVKRLLALSPFYEPSSTQSPKWQIRPLLVFYGNNLLPDKLNKPDDPQHALSYWALAKYVTVFKNLPKSAKNTGLQHVAVVMADDDGLIDQPLALKTLGGIAGANHISLERYQVPTSYQLGHDIISPDNSYVVQHQSFLLQKYFSLYEQ